MKIGVVGGGAIGLLMAFYLSSGFETVLYVRRPEQKAELITNGITIKGKKGKAIRTLQIKLIDEPFEEDLMIFAVKQPILKKNINEWLKKCQKKQSLLFLQNGASHIPFLLESGFPAVFIGMIEFGSRKLNDTMIQQIGEVKIRVGVLNGALNQLHSLYGLEGFNVLPVEGNWEQLVFDKLIINAVINPLTALYKVTNGGLFENRAHRMAARLLFEESSLILFGTVVENHWKRILEISRETAANHSSMRQDIDSARETEIEAITGFIIDRAKIRGLDCPLSQLIYFSIRGLDNTIIESGGTT